VARYRKDALRPGKYSVPDHTGKGRRILAYSDADTKHLARRFRDMKDAGLRVPVCWEHQGDATPASSLAHRATHHIGYLDAEHLAGDNLLEFEMEIADADAPQFERVGLVSPGIMTDWVDGDGRLWPGRSIVHLAVTPRPVQHRQGMPEKLSHPALPHNLECLSLADRLGDENMADDNPFEKKDDDAPEKEEGGEDVEVAEEVAEESDAPGKPEKKDVGHVVAALQEHGIHLPDDTTEKNFYDRICTALHALKNAGDTGANDPLDPNADTQTEPSPVPDSNPVMMSMKDENARLKKRNAVLEAESLELHRGKLVARIRKLRETGRVSKPVQDKLLGELKAENLSIADDGKLAEAKLLIKVEAYEALERGEYLGMGRDDDAAKPSPIPDPEADALRQRQTEMADKLSGGRFSRQRAETNGK
jgi:hypothetical protein